MIENSYKVIAVTGFARTACLIVNYASKFKSNIVLSYRGVSINLNDSPKSIMDIMSLRIKTGSSVNILIDGKDEILALKTLECYLSDTLYSKTNIS